MHPQWERHEIMKRKDGGKMMECTQRRHSKTVTGFNDEGQKGQIKLNQDKL